MDGRRNEGDTLVSDFGQSSGHAEGRVEIRDAHGDVDGLAAAISLISMSGTPFERSRAIARGLCTKPGTNPAAATPAEFELRVLRIGREVALDQQQLQVAFLAGVGHALDLFRNTGVDERRHHGAYQVRPLRIDDAIWSGTNPTPRHLHDARQSVGSEFPGFRNARETVIAIGPTLGRWSARYAASRLNVFASFWRP